MTKLNFGPTETLIISLRFLFLNQPRGSLEGLSRCRVILLTHFDAPRLQSASKIRHFQESPVSSSANPMEVRCGERRTEFRDFLKTSMTKSNFGPTETLIISVCFLFLNQPRGSLEGLSRCRVILLTRFNVPWLQISEIFGTPQPPVTRLVGVPLWIVDRGTGFRDFLKY